MMKSTIPSQKIEISLLAATPLFLLILAVLNTTNETSYLFILDFINNISGKSDIIFLPTFQPQYHTDNLYKDLVMQNYKIKSNNDTNFFTSMKIPLVNVSHIEQWKQNKRLVQGIAPRWLVPVVSQCKNKKNGDKIDSLLMVINISKQLDVGFGTKSNLQTLNRDQIAIPQQLFNRLNIKINQKINIKFAIKNLFNGMKLIDKFQDPTSRDQFTTEQKQINLTKISQQLYNQLIEYNKNNSGGIPLNISKQKLQSIITQVYQSQLNLEYKVKYVYKQNGLFPSVLHNVILMQYPSFAQLITQFIKLNIIKNKQLNLTQYIPLPYVPLYQLYLSNPSSSQPLTQYFTHSLQQYSIMVLCLLKHRELVYHPNKPLYSQFSQILQKSPKNVEVIAIYPFYKQSLGIKYFFGSIIQIFEVVTCLIYFYTMSLIMKQIYEEKEIQVGIWRTLGAGGVKMEKIPQQNNNINNSNQLRQQFMSYKLNSRLSFKQRMLYYYQILVKIGFMYYWLASSFISILLYMLLKYIFIGFICKLLNFDPIQQSKSSAIILFLSVFLLSQILSLSHIYNIYISPLVSTIKPIKRTFDQVKIRIIHLSTFGISSQTLLIALMLIYYGVVSYYWIPFSILDKDGDLQVSLFNSIFIFMIFGAIILLSVMQSRLQRFILRGIFMVNQRVNKMKMIMLKNIKAKQYKNIKMSIIIAVTFAFLLFFSTGINIQIMIVQSFIERDLGASLVLQNYQKKSFNKTEVDLYLNTLQNVKYAWLSSDINSQGIDIKLINLMDPDRDIKVQFKVLTANYLDSTFYQYYYPQQYMSTTQNSNKNNNSITSPIVYHKLANNIYDGFDSLYLHDNKFNNLSIGRYNSNDTMTSYDPYNINTWRNSQNWEQDYNHMAPEEQIINFAASYLLKLQTGARVGDLYKMKISGWGNDQYHKYNIRSKIVHSYKIGPGMDLLRPQAFITEQQAKYLKRIIGRSQQIRYQKLMITGPSDKLKQIGNRILSISPQHTQMFQMQLVSHSFSLLQTYLKGYIILISVIMGGLAVLFIFLYTLNKCKDEAEMYKMLRAVGLEVRDIRIMIFLEILIRLFVAIVNGILLGIVFSLGFAMQIEQFLMLNTPGLDLTLIFIIAVVMFSVFCITVYVATKYLTKKTVSDTSKL